MPKWTQKPRWTSSGSWRGGGDPGAQMQVVQRAPYSRRIAYCDPKRRPVCLTCPHEFHVNARMPSAWMFVRLSANKAGVPRQMILVGICEKCAARDDAILLRGGFAELRRAFPDMPEFKMHVVQEWSGVVN